MSEVVDSVMTAGAILRSARESKGVEIAALATVLKVPVAKLEALEADNYVFLSDTVFIRALAASVCRSLKLETDSVLALLPKSPGLKLMPDYQGLNTSLKDMSNRSPFLPSTYIKNAGVFSKSLILTTILFLVAIFIYSTSRIKLHEVIDNSIILSDVVSGKISNNESNNSSASVFYNNQNRVNPSSPLKKPISEELKNSTILLNINPTPTNVANSISNLVQSDSTEPIVLRATSESWVQVKDATGSIVLQRNLMAGENITLSALPPLSFIVGRADATEVSVRGKSFDMSGVTRDNVARFEVK